jgi:hypothetical protein
MNTLCFRYGSSFIDCNSFGELVWKSKTRSNWDWDRGGLALLPRLLIFEKIEIFRTILEASYTRSPDHEKFVGFNQLMYTKNIALNLTHLQ